MVNYEGLIGGLWQDAWVVGERLWEKGLWILNQNLESLGEKGKMGWEGSCFIEEKVEGQWVPLANIDQHTDYTDFVNHRRMCMNSSFVEFDDEPEDLEVLAMTGSFLWSEYVKATSEDLNNGGFRESEEVIDRLFDSPSMQQLALALLDRIEAGIEIRVTCDIGF